VAPASRSTKFSPSRSRDSVRPGTESGTAAGSRRRPQKGRKVMPAKNCQECQQIAKFLLVNGELQAYYCKDCAIKECGEMVIYNTVIMFSQRDNADGITLLVVGAS
jgi:hypothetical protein